TRHLRRGTGAARPVRRGDRERGGGAPCLSSRRPDRGHARLSTEAGGIVNHDEQPFRVVGIIAPTFTPIDRALYVTLEGIEAMHLGFETGVPAAMPGATPPAMPGA